MTTNKKAFLTLALVAACCAQTAHGMDKNPTKEEHVVLAKKFYKSKPQWDNVIHNMVSYEYPYQNYLPLVAFNSIIKTNPVNKITAQLFLLIDQKNSPTTFNEQTMKMVYTPKIKQGDPLVEDILNICFQEDRMKKLKTVDFSTLEKLQTLYSFCKTNNFKLACKSMRSYMETFNLMCGAPQHLPIEVCKKITSFCAKNEDELFITIPDSDITFYKIMCGTGAFLTFLMSHHGVCLA